MAHRLRPQQRRPGHGSGDRLRLHGRAASGRTGNRGAARTDDRRDAQQWANERQRQPASPYTFQPPVIVVTGSGQPGAGAGWPGQPALGPPSNAYGPPQGNGWEQLPANRQFRVVGEQEEWLRD